MMRQMKLAAFAVAVTLVLGSLAAAQDRDDDDDNYYYQQGNPAQARQYGYQNGYRDGYRKGRHEGRENDPNDYRSPDWGQAMRGYEPWMGPVNWFQKGYREGYPNGFQAGYQSTSLGDGDGDRDDQPYYGGDYPYGGNGPYYGNRPWAGGNVGYNFGYRDGSSVAREDIAQHKPYNPKPRGRYDDEDHGYRREYGDKGAYKAQYANGYRAGYQAAFGNRY